MAEAAIPDHRACSRPARKRHVRQAQTRRTQAVTPCTQAVAPCTQAVAPCTQAVAPCIQAAVHAADETAQQGHVARQVARRSEDQRPADPHQERTCMGTRRIMQVLCGARANGVHVLHMHTAHAHAAAMRHAAARRCHACSTSTRRWCWPPPRTYPPRRARRASAAPARTRRRSRPRPRPAPATARAHPPPCADRARTPGKAQGVESAIWGWDPPLSRGQPCASWASRAVGGRKGRCEHGHFDHAGTPARPVARAAT